LNRKKILILGCGSIGSRHLQALTNLPYDLEIAIIDPNDESKKIAKTRLIDSNYDSKKHTVVWYDKIKNIKPSLCPIT
jgi:malate/lactate dehydrogenase